MENDEYLPINRNIKTGEYYVLIDGVKKILPPEINVYEKIGENYNKEAALKNSDIKCSKDNVNERGNVWFVSSIELMLNEVMRSKGVPADVEENINSFNRGGKKSKKYRKRRIRKTRKYKGGMEPAACSSSSSKETNLVDDFRKLLKLHGTEGSSVFLCLGRALAGLGTNLYFLV